MNKTNETKQAGNQEEWIGGAYYNKSNPHLYWWVAQVPGEEGVDWGFTDKIEQARPLNKYYQRRWGKACRDYGVRAFFEKK